MNVLKNCYSSPIWNNYSSAGLKPYNDKNCESLYNEDSNKKNWENRCFLILAPIDLISKIFYFSIKTLNRLFLAIKNPSKKSLELYRNGRCKKNINEDVLISLNFKDSELKKLTSYFHETKKTFWLDEMTRCEESFNLKIQDKICLFLKRSKEKIEKGKLPYKVVVYSEQKVLGKGYCGIVNKVPYISFSGIEKYLAVKEALLNDEKTAISNKDYLKNNDLIVSEGIIMKTLLETADKIGNHRGLPRYYRTTHLQSFLDNNEQFQKNLIITKVALGDAEHFALKVAIDLSLKEKIEIAKGFYDDALNMIEIAKAAKIRPRDLYPNNFIIFLKNNKYEMVVLDTGRFEIESNVGNTKPVFHKNYITSQFEKFIANTDLKEEKTLQEELKMAYFATSLTLYFIITGEKTPFLYNKKGNNKTDKISENGYKNLLEIQKEDLVFFKKIIKDLQIEKSKFFSINKNVFFDKNILILSCGFGNGHNITANALASHFTEKGVNTTVIDTTKEIFNTELINSSCDTSYSITKKILAQPLRVVDIFNWSLDTKNYWIFNLKNRVDTFFFDHFNYPTKNGVAPPAPYQSTYHKDALEEAIKKTKPDFIITTYHMDEHPILEIAAKYSIRVLHIPTDFSIKADEIFSRTAIKQRHFKTLLPFNDPEVKKTAFPLKDNHLLPCPTPIRKSFYRCLTNHEIVQLREKNKVPEGAKVVVILNGGNGAYNPICEAVANDNSFKEKVHFIIVAGKNNNLVSILSKNLKINEHTSHFFGSNPHITIQLAKDEENKDLNFPYLIGDRQLNEYMELSSAAFIKSGGISVNECIHKKIPMIFDRIVTPFEWEDFNIDCAVRWGRGIKLNHPQEFTDCLSRALRIKKEKAAEQIEENPYEVIDRYILEEFRKSEVCRRSHIDHRTIALEQLTNRDSLDLNKNWSIADFVHSVVYINLAGAHDRRQKMEEHLKEIGFTEAQYSRLEAVNGRSQMPDEIAGLKIPKDLHLKMQNNFIEADPTTEEGRLALERLHKGQVGCLLSHYKAIKNQLEQYESAEDELFSLLDKFKNGSDQNGSDQEKLEYEAKINDCKQRLRKFSRRLIIEDDNRFGRKIDNDNFTTEIGAVFRLAMADLPDHFDVFFFSALVLHELLHQPGKYCQQIEASYDLNAYIVNIKACRPLLDRLERAIMDPNERLEPIDVLFADMMQKKEINAFVATPPLAMQDRRMASSISLIKEGLVQHGNHLWDLVDSDPFKFSLEPPPLYRREEKKSVTINVL